MKIVLDAKDFAALVAGKVVAKEEEYTGYGTEPVEIILSDIGFVEMYAAMQRAFAPFADKGKY